VDAVSPAEFYANKTEFITVAALIFFPAGAHNLGTIISNGVRLIERKHSSQLACWTQPGHRFYSRGMCPVCLPSPGAATGSSASAYASNYRSSTHSAPRQMKDRLIAPLCKKGLYIWYGDEGTGRGRSPPGSSLYQM